MQKKHVNICTLVETEVVHWVARNSVLTLSSRIPHGSIYASVIEDIKKTAKPHSSCTTLNIRLNPFAFLTIFLTWPLKISVYGQRKASFCKISEAQQKYLWACRVDFHQKTVSNSEWRGTSLPASACYCPRQEDFQAACRVLVDGIEVTSAVLAELLVVLVRV